MDTYLRYLHILAIIGIFVSDVHAIKCYRCNSELDTACHDAFGTTNIQILDCNTSLSVYMSTYFENFRATGCLKKVVHVAGRDPITVRSCFFGDLNDKKTGCVKDILWPHYHDVPYESQKCQVCNTDLCNSSTVGKPFGVAIALFFAITCLMI